MRPLAVAIDADGAVQWLLYIALVQTESEESPQGRLHRAPGRAAHLLNI